MKYAEEFKILKTHFKQDKDIVSIPSLNIHYINCTFNSDFSSEITSDSAINENNSFRYTIVKRELKSKSSRVIILLHGLNEKSWDKYLPWAKKLNDLTGKDVLLFPISFHMNRTPVEWSDSRIMKKVSVRRVKQDNLNTKSSFANASLSDRLQEKPQRFFWSGLKTINDLIKLTRQVRTGEHEHIDSMCTIDFFGYSIGGFLSEILLMSDPLKFYNDSKLVLFCSGSTFNSMRPVSKFIVDELAYNTLNDFYVKNFESNIKQDEKIKNHYRKFTRICTYFKSMLDFNKMIQFRERKLKELHKRICSISLHQDKVIPWTEVLKTLKGKRSTIPIETHLMDFNYEYDHENPFPVMKKIEKDVDRCFNRVFELAAGFLE